jgi:hypothetical protein
MARTICRFADITEMPCEDGFSRRIYCGKKLSVCVRSCTNKCPGWEPMEIPTDNNSEVINVTVFNHGSGCGGCGQNITYG